MSIEHSTYYIRKMAEGRKWLSKPEYSVVEDKIKEAMVMAYAMGALDQLLEIAPSIDIQKAMELSREMDDEAALAGQGEK